MAGDYPQLGGKDHLFLLHADGKGKDRTVFPEYRADAGRNPSQAHLELLSARAENRVARYSDPLSRQYHANIHKALKYAVKMDLIPFNPADKVERPKKQRYIADCYRQEELERLLEASKDHPYSLLIQMTAFYGLRRSEALGARWSRVDWENKTILLDTKIIEYKENGKVIVKTVEEMKNKSSRRTLPLPDPVYEMLCEEREKQDLYRRMFKGSYNRKYDDYICVDQLGGLIRPNRVTQRFADLIKQYGLRKIRFHDLRHTFASILINQDVPLLNVSTFLGHSDLSTTANIYAHLDKSKKQESADVISSIFNKAKE